MWTEGTIMGAKTAIVVSAATGGAVAAFRAKGPWWMRFATGISGAAVSYFCTPIVAPIAEAAMEWGLDKALSIRLDLDPASVLGATGFLLGCIGMELLQVAVDVIRGDRTLVGLRRGRAGKAAPANDAGG